MVTARADPVNFADVNGQDIRGDIGDWFSSHAQTFACVGLNVATGVVAAAEVGGVLVFVGGTGGLGAGAALAGGELAAAYLQEGQIQPTRDQLAC